MFLGKSTGFSHGLNIKLIISQDVLYMPHLQQFASLIMLTNFPTIMMTVNILSLISSSAMLIIVRQVLITEYKVYMLVVSWANEVYRYGYSGTTMVCRHL